MIQGIKKSRMAEYMGCQTSLYGPFCTKLAPCFNSGNSESFDFLTVQIAHKPSIVAETKKIVTQLKLRQGEKSSKIKIAENCMKT